MNTSPTSAAQTRRPGGRRLIQSALAAMLLAVGAGATAAPLTYYFGGTIDTAVGNAAGYSGQAFTGRLLYDPAAPLLGAGGNFKNYAGPAAAVTFGVGGDGWTSGAGEQWVLNRVASTLGAPWVADGLGSLGLAGSGTGALAGLDALYLFQDIDMDVLASLDLPAQMPTFDDPRLRGMSLAAEDRDASFNTLGGFTGAVSCFSARLGDCGSGGGGGGTPVPEPGTLALVAAGLIAARRRRASF